MTNTSPRVTAFAETAALYAVLNEDEVYARSIVADMLPSERATFAGQLDTLRAMLTDQFGNDLCQVHGFTPDDPRRGRLGLCIAGACRHPAGADCHPRT